MKAVSIPSIHLHGSQDPWRSESEMLAADFFDEHSSTIIEYTGGHQVPIQEKDTSRIVLAIRRLAAETL
jgi:hypothetical protein